MQIMRSSIVDIRYNIIQAVLTRLARHIARQNRILILEHSTVHLILNKEHIVLWIRDMTTLQIIVIGLVVFRVLAEVPRQVINRLRTSGMILKRLVHPQLHLQRILHQLIALGNLIMTVPDFLTPSTNLNTAFVMHNRLLESPQIFQALTQVKMCTGIVRILLDFLRQQTNITLELVRLAPTIVLVVNIEHVVGDLCRWITRPILMCRTNTLPRIPTLHKAGIVILQVAIGLNDSIAVRG